MAKPQTHVYSTTHLFSSLSLLLSLAPFPSWNDAWVILPALLVHLPKCKRSRWDSQAKTQVCRNYSMVKFYYKINLISTQGPLPAKVTGNLTFRQYRIPPCSLLGAGIGPRFQGLTLPRHQEVFPIIRHLSSVILAGPCSRPHGPCLCHSEVTQGAS